MQSIWLSLYYIRCIAAAKRCITIARSLRVRVYWLDCLSLTNCYCAQVDNPSVISSPTAFCLSSTLYTVYKSPGTALEPANWISLIKWKCLLAKKNVINWSEWEARATKPVKYSTNEDCKKLQLTFSSSNKWIRSTCNALIIYNNRKLQQWSNEYNMFDRQNSTPQHDYRVLMKVWVRVCWQLIALTSPSSSALFVSSGRFSFSSIWTNAWMSLVNESGSVLPFDVPFGLDDVAFGI